MMQELGIFRNATVATTGMASAMALMAGAAQAQDFDGFYMGLSLSTLSGDTPLGDYPFGDQYSLQSNGTVGMFVGYNATISGGMVVGAELAFQGNTPGDKDDLASYDTYSLKHVIDLKAKAGSVVNAGGMPVLLYGFAGMSSGNAAAYYGDYDFSGFNYGLGADMKVSENFSVGLEILGRTVESYNGYDGDKNTNHSQISLRGAFHF